MSLEATIALRLGQLALEVELAVATGELVVLRGVEVDFNVNTVELVERS